MSILNEKIGDGLGHREQVSVIKRNLSLRRSRWIKHTNIGRGVHARIMARKEKSYERRIIREMNDKYTQNITKVVKESLSLIPEGKSIPINSDPDGLLKMPKGIKDTLTQLRQLDNRILTAGYDLTQSNIVVIEGMITDIAHKYVAYMIYTLHATSFAKMKEALGEGEPLDEESEQQEAMGMCEEADLIVGKLLDSNTKEAVIIKSSDLFSKIVQKAYVNAVTNTVLPEIFTSLVTDIRFGDKKTQTTAKQQLNSWFSLYKNMEVPNVQVNVTNVKSSPDSSESRTKAKEHKADEFWG